MTAFGRLHGYPCSPCHPWPIYFDRLKDFTTAGHAFRGDLSSDSDWVFTRPQPELVGKAKKRKRFKPLYGLTLVTKTGSTLRIGLPSGKGVGAVVKTGTPRLFR